MKLISIKKAKEIWDNSNENPGEALWVLSGEYNEDDEPLLTTICPEDGFPEDVFMFLVKSNNRDFWVHDFGNSRVITEDDELVFYTHDLTCDIEIVSHVVLLHNQNTIGAQELGSCGIIDKYLLDAMCTQEDRELIVESIFEYLENK